MSHNASLHGGEIRATFDVSNRRESMPAEPMATTTSDPRYLLHVVDDDAQLRQMLSSYLESHGMAVNAMGSAEELLARVEHEPPDLIILDVALAGMSGLDACRRLRAAGNRVPIMMLTALSDEVDRIVGLEMGADDYQCKPFSARELVARIHSLLRRSQTLSLPPPAEPASVRIGEFTFVPATRSLRRGDSVRVLHTVEHALLAALCARPGSPVSRERLHAACHPQRSAALLRTIDAGVMRLRRLLEPDPTEPRFIQTVRGQGYMFVPQARRSGEPAGAAARSAPS